MQIKKLVSDIIKISDDLEKKDTQLLYQEKIIDGLRSQVKTLNDIIEEKDDTIDFNRKKFHYWHKAYNEVTDVKGCRYVFSEIPNDTEGQEFVDTCKKYLNRESYTIRVKGQHIKDELRGQGRTAYGQNLSESSCMRIYIDTKKTSKSAFYKLLKLSKDKIFYFIIMIMGYDLSSTVQMLTNRKGLLPPASRKKKNG